MSWATSSADSGGGPTRSPARSSSERGVLVGRWAAALHGSPIIDGPRLIEIVPAVDEQNTDALHAALTSIDGAYDKTHDAMAGSHVWQLWRMPHKSMIAVSPQPKGTHGTRTSRATVPVSCSPTGSSPRPSRGGPPPDDASGAANSSDLDVACSHRAA